jgi:hypothetical protein
METDGARLGVVGLHHRLANLCAGIMHECSVPTRPWFIDSSGLFFVLLPVLIKLAAKDCSRRPCAAETEDADGQLHFAAAC